jgi:hypothetical protein
MVLLHHIAGMKHHTIHSLNFSFQISIISQRSLKRLQHPLVTLKRNKEKIKVTQYTFTSKEELLEQALKDNPCSEGYNWACKRTFKTIIKRIPLNYRFWCLCKGYVQFEEDCPWHRFKGDDWTILILNQPHLAERCHWEKLSREDWVNLLVEQPQLSENCPWDKLNHYDWTYLLVEQPQLSENCPWDKLSGFCWTNLLSKQPQFAKFCDWEKMSLENFYAILKVQPQLQEYLK